MKLPKETVVVLNVYCSPSLEPQRRKADMLRAIKLEQEVGRKLNLLQVGERTVKFGLKRPVYAWRRTRKGICFINNSTTAKVLLPGVQGYYDKWPTEKIAPEAIGI
jgi:hypothetical protein